jgi:glyoxylase-like metal-dependent hydrolase (beta-lactamase superfamily II)
MRRLPNAITLLALFSGTALADGPLFDLRKVADGVYAAIALPRTPINCNAAVIVYDEGVLVVDTHSRPSSARSLVEQIKTLTDKPVRYAVNTHFHWDHAQGNQAYPVAFPRQVAIVASEATRESLKAEGLARVKQQLEQAPAAIAERRKQLATEQDPAQRTRLEDEVRQHETYMAELQGLDLVLPDLTFDKSLILHRKDRDIVLLFMGRGHTSGDVVAYLPQQRVVATGDLLHGWMPFMADAYPPEWVATLDQLGRLDFDWIIGGHGGVKPRAHLVAFRTYLADLIEETRRARGRGESLDRAKAAVATALRPRHAEVMGGYDSFDQSIGANVEKVYRDLEAGRYP